MSMNTYYYVAAWVLLLHSSRLLNGEACVAWSPLNSYVPMFFHTGAVTISPSGVATVCSGGQLELNCTIADTGSFTVLVWNVILIPMNLTQAVSSSSPSDQTLQNLINSTNLTFSRISPQNSFSLVSSLLISPVSDHLNGTKVKCINSMTSETSSVTIVNISNGNPIQGMTLYSASWSREHAVIMMRDWFRDLNLPVIWPLYLLNYPACMCKG